MTMRSRNLSYRRDFLGKRFRDSDQICNQPLFHIEVALILRHIAPLMAKCQYPPVFRPETKRVLQALKDKITILGAVAVPTESRDGHGGGCVVGKIEGTFDGQR